MLDLDQWDNLARLYRLFVMVPTGRVTLRRALKDSILRRGSDINQMYGDENSNRQDAIVEVVGDPKGKGKARNVTTPNADVASKWVEDVLNLKDKFDQFWRHCFDSDREFETSCNEVRFLIILYPRRAKICYIRPLKRLSIVTHKLQSIYPYLSTRT